MTARRRRPSRALACFGLPLLAIGLAGCGSLLPRASSEQPSAFDSFEAAQRALEQVVPFRTTVAELSALGFDRDNGRNVTRVPYPDVITRLAPHPGVPLESLDEGGGWRFDGLVVVRGDVVVFRNFGGEARIDRTERQVNPLGPLQRAGDAIGARVLN